MTMVSMFRRYGRRSFLPALLLSALTPLVSSVASAAPPNDKCPGAEVVPPAGPFPHLTTVIPDLNTATTTGDPTPSCVNSFSRGVWYSFTPAETAEYRISDCNPPTSTTVYDSVLAVYSSSNGACNGTMTQVVNGCSDDECEKRSAVTVTLNAGTTYYIVAYKWGTGALPVGETAMQVEVTKSPSNDTCENATNLPLNRTIKGQLTLASNDYEVSTTAPNCYSLPSPPDPIGQSPVNSPASGRDVAYTFTAPADGSYTFKAQALVTGGNLIVHVAPSCPTGAGPHTLTDCLGAANRNLNTTEYYGADEVACVPLTAGQKVYVFIDEAAMTMAGGRFTLEATTCQREAEPNDDPTQAVELSCGLLGTITPSYDEDYYALGALPAGSRVFAMADGVAANDGDFDMRITTATDTLEYDDSNNATPWGAASPNIAGCPLTGGPSFLKMNHFSGMTDAEPYHLYTIVQPPGSGLGGSSASAESEPNDTVGGATTAGNLFFSGTISTGGVTGDKDLFKFCAEEGDLIFLSIDGDPLRDETALDPTVLLLDTAGNQLLNWSDAGNISVAFPSPDTLYGTTPRFPGEAAVYRATYSGVHYAGVQTQFQNESYGTGDYLYSIAINCLRGDQLRADLGINITDSPDPIGSDEAMDLKIEVDNQGPHTALDATWHMTIPATTTFQGISAATGWTCNVAGSDITCSTTCFPAGSLATFNVKLKTDICPPPGPMQHAATVSSKTPDGNATNDTIVATTEIIDGSPCDDGNVCTTMDSCSSGACAGGPPLNCNDGNVCTDEVCVPGTGCKYTNNTNTCDDSNACTTADKCSGGKCVGGAPPNCDDGDVCTDDTCDSAIGCMSAFNTAPCEDGNKCTGNDTCSSGTCMAGPPIGCVPPDDCLENGVCNPVTGACTFSSKPDGTSCDDKNACLMNDKCQAGVCTGSTPIDCPPPPDECHGAGTCNPSIGSCEYPLVGDDLDGDGQGDKCDKDIDGDGLTNDEETAWGTNPMSKDSDSDNIDDCTEACVENDGSCFDGTVCKVDRPANTDGDDYIDALDSDSDNDGSSDAAEAGDTDLTTPPVDRNGDGIPDYRDAKTGAIDDDVGLSGGCGACSTPIGQETPMNSWHWLAGLGLFAAWWRRARRSVQDDKFGAR